MYEELRHRAAEEALTIRDYVLRLIERDQRLPSKMALAVVDASVVVDLLVAHPRAAAGRDALDGSMAWHRRSSMPRCCTP
jgi:hypothetical protein